MQVMHLGWTQLPVLKKGDSGLPIIGRCVCPVIKMTLFLFAQFSPASSTFPFFVLFLAVLVGSRKPICSNGFQTYRTRNRDNLQSTQLKKSA